MAFSGPLALAAASALLLVAACSAPPTPPEARNSAEGGVAGEVVPQEGNAASDADLLACDNVFTEAQWAATGRTAGDADLHRIVVQANGRFGFNGEEVDTARLRQYLELLSQLTPAPILLVSLQPGVQAGKERELAGLVTGTFHCRPDL